MSVLYIPQKISPEHKPRLPVFCLSHEEALAALTNVGADVLGLSLLLGGQGAVEAIALATPEEAYYMTLSPIQQISDKAVTSTMKTSTTSTVPVPSLFSLGQITTIAGFSMARLALLVHQSHGWHTCGVDLSTLLMSSRERPHSASDFLSKKVNMSINHRDVNQLWYADDGDGSERMQRACLRAWISAVCAHAFSAFVQNAYKINTHNLSAKGLACISRMVLTTELVTAQKPLRMENEFRAVETGTEEGTVVIENARYNTRVRRSQTTTVAFETKDGKRIDGQAIGQEGKKTTVLIKGQFRGGVVSVTVHGREEQTNAELASDSFILRLLQGEIVFKNITRAPSTKRSTFIDMIWFPPANHRYRREVLLDPTLKNIDTPLLKKLNGSQREVAHAMLSDSIPLVIAHGPPGTGKTSTIAAAVEYFISQWRPVWVVAQSNVAVKNIARSFIAKKVINFKIIVSKEFYVEWHEHLYKEIEDRVIRSDDISQFKDTYEVERLLNGSTIVLCTLCMLSNPVLDQIRMWKVLPPETLIIDEGSQINVSELMHVFYKFDDLKKVCFFGDPKQLPPYLQDSVTSIQSIFDITHLRPLAYFLNTQYRMPVPLGDFISHEMYDSKLKSEHRITTPSCVAFVDVAKGKEERCGKSWLNVEEVNMTVTLIRNYYRYKDCCVITPYDAQRTAIQKALEGAGLPSDRVFNVDSFQGHEASFIIVSTVRTTNLGFLTFDCRINVMLSRCTAGMVLVTNRAFIQRAHWTLIGKLAAHWSRLPGPHATWIDRQLVLGNNANLPGFDAPRASLMPTRTLVPAPAAVVRPVQMALSTRTITSSTQRTAAGSAAPLENRMARLQIENTIAKDPRLPATEQFPALCGVSSKPRPEAARLRLKGSWRYGSDVLKY